MSYAKRIQLAVLASLALHILFLSIPYLPKADDAFSFAAADEPLVLNLQPEAEEDDAVKRLVDGGVESNESSESTDLISDRSTKAQDSSDATSAENRPDTGDVSDFEELSTPPVEAQPEPIATPPAPPAQPAVTETEAEDIPAEEPSPEEPETDAPEPSEEEVERVEPELLDVLEPEPAPTPKPTEETAEPAPTDEDQPIDPEKGIDEVLERYAMAQSPAAPPVPQDPGVTRGREGAGALEKGAVSFEANEHVFGAYMQEIRRRVERKWKTAIQLRYSGAQSTYALVECAISPQGEVMYVNIKEEGNSATFGALCRQAILDSGPFPPFPFSIPSVYRNRNLEIRWKFSYM